VHNFDVKKTILSQFQNAKTMTHILQETSKMLAIGVEEIVDNLMDIDKAEGVFLENFGKIFGARREIRNIYNAGNDFGFDSIEFYGFDEHGGTFDNKAALGDTILLNDVALRSYIKMKSLESDGSIYDINKNLKTIFGHRGTSWVELTSGMDIALIFSFALEVYEINLILNGAFDLPPGYHISIVQVYT
jgi:Protein of unknown function (DUF2612).